MRVESKASGSAWTPLNARRSSGIASVGSTRWQDHIFWPDRPASQAPTWTLTPASGRPRSSTILPRTDADGEEIPCAFVVLAEAELPIQQTAERIRAFVAERLTNYKVPREIHFVETLPRTASGKILRRELRKLV